MSITGIHHITAITGDLQANLDFYVRVLGLRLVKRTVIQEEPNTYHLFYGDAAGTVGSDMTFFDWPHLGRDRAGARNVVRTLLYVPDATAMTAWAKRFDTLKIAYTRHTDYVGREQIHFADSDGQRLGLIAGGENSAYQHWAANPVPQAAAIRGVHSVVLGVRELEPTVSFLVDVLGYERGSAFISTEANEARGITLTLGEGGAGRELVVVERTEAQFGFRAIGSVHHVALSISTDDAIEDWHTRLAATGLKVTDVVRRHYFDSLYIRIPGGILFELATSSGALTIDEDADHLGERLTLPPFLEHQRAQIEAQLKPITLPDFG